MLAQMRQLYVIAMLVWVTAAAPFCFGKDSACTLLVAKATGAQVDVLGLLDERDASHRDNPLHAGRAAERLLYIAVACPDLFFSEVEDLEPSQWFSRWRTALRENATLQPDERLQLIAAAKFEALRQTAHGKRTDQLLEDVSKTPAHAITDRCGATFRHLLIGLSDDWMARSGALWFDYSNSMLFMLASCPEDAYYVLDQRPEVLSSWLEKLPKASFWGDPAQVKQLQRLQQSLVQLLGEENPPGYLQPTYEQILHRLKTLCVTAVDETMPCESRVER